MEEEIKEEPELSNSRERLSSQVEQDIDQAGYHGYNYDEAGITPTNENMQENVGENYRSWGAV